MKRIYFIQFFTALLVLTFLPKVQSQENLPSGQRKEIISPEINADNSVTFRLVAPNAKEVFVTGDFLIPGEESKMTKESDGIWSYTKQPLTSEVYTYAFNVDGVQMNNPNNVYYRRDVASTLNLLLIVDV